MMATYLHLGREPATLCDMRAHPTASISLLFLAFAGLQLCAQTNTGAPTPPPDAQAARENRMISFLSPADQVKYAQARAKALADNPQLKSEGEALLAQGQSVMSDGTPEDKQAFMEQMMSHRQKLRQAMLKEDSTLGPVFAAIDKHISEMKAKQLGQVQNSAPPTNAPPAGQ
jgi:hypothetical protein